MHFYEHHEQSDRLQSRVEPHRACLKQPLCRTRNSAGPRQGSPEETPRAVNREFPGCLARAGTVLHSGSSLPSGPWGAPPHNGGSFPPRVCGWVPGRASNWPLRSPLPTGFCLCFCHLGLPTPQLSPLHCRPPGSAWKAWQGASQGRSWSLRSPLSACIPDHCPSPPAGQALRNSCSVSVLFVYPFRAGGKSAPLLSWPAPSSYISNS